MSQSMQLFLMPNFSACLVGFLFVATILGLIKYQNSSHKVFGCLFLVLYASGLVSTEQVVDSFSNQGVLTLVLLMVCSLAIEKTRLMRSVANFTIRSSYRSSWLRLYFLTGLSSAFLNNTAVVSTMLAPIRNNSYHAASKLLLPLSYSAIIGGTLTLVGTSTNLIVNSLVLESDLEPLKFFDFTLVGLCLFVVCGVGLFYLSRNLPERVTQSANERDYFIDAEVSANSSLIGKSIEVNGLRNLEAIYLVEILREGRLISPVSPQEVIREKDRLLFSGDIKKVTLLNQFDGLSLFAHENGLPLDNLTEAIVKPDSVLVGQTLKQAGFRALFDAAVVAIRRDGEQVSGKLGEVILKPGDYLVLAIGKDFKSRRNINKNFFLVSGVETEHLLEGKQEWLAIIGFVSSILLAAVGVLPLFKGVVLLLGTLLFTGALKPSEVLHRFPRNIWVITSAALLLSHALSNTDALAFIGHFLTSKESAFTPFIALVSVYILTWLITELVTNNAAAALVFPIAFELGMSMGGDIHSFILVVAFGASASFISPYGYQTNLMVYNAGQYKIADFVKAGVPMALLYGTTVILAITLIYGI